MVVNFPQRLLPTLATVVNQDFHHGAIFDLPRTAIQNLLLLRLNHLVNIDERKMRDGY
jgi:hypothetical protein